MAPKGKKTLAGHPADQPEPQKKQKSYRSRVLEEAKKQGVETSESPNKSMSAAEQEAALKEAAQSNLPGIEPDLPQMVVIDGKMICQLNCPTYGEGDKLIDKYVDAEFSFPLEEEHQPYLPKAVIRCWKFIDQKYCDGVTRIRMSDQTIDVYLVPDQAEPSFHIHARPITKATLGIIEEKGGGKSKKRLRFLFRVRCEVTDATSKFLDTHYGIKVWIVMGDTEPELYR